MHPNPPVLDPGTVRKLVDAANKSGRHRLRNALIVRMMYSHALRLAETVDIRWGGIDLRRGRLRFMRRRSGQEAIRALSEEEIELLRELKSVTEFAADNDPVFATWSGEPLTPDAVRKVITAAARKARIKQPIGPRILRRSAGARVGAVTRDVDAVRALLGVSLRVSAVTSVPVSKSNEQADPWT